MDRVLRALVLAVFAVLAWLFWVGVGASPAAALDSGLNLTDSASLPAPSIQGLAPPVMDAAAALTAEANSAVVPATEVVPSATGTIAPPVTAVVVPINDTLAPVTEAVVPTVTAVLAPVTEGVVPTVTAVLAPVVEVVPPPVTEAVDTVLDTVEQFADPLEPGLPPVPGDPVLPIVPLPLPGVLQPGLPPVSNTDPREPPLPQPELSSEAAALAAAAGADSPSWRRPASDQSASGQPLGSGLYPSQSTLFAIESASSPSLPPGDGQGLEFPTVTNQGLGPTGWSGAGGTALQLAADTPGTWSIQPQSIPGLIAISALRMPAAPSFDPGSRPD